MLTIRQEQIRAFQEARFESFLRKLLSQAREKIPAVFEGRSEEDLLELLRGALRKAASFGIILADDTARYGLLVLRVGRDPAAENGPLMEVLNDPDLVGAAKLDALERVKGTGDRSDGVA